MAKLLLVEDDNNLREIYEARLQAEGYTIVSARDGEEALVVAKAEKPDLVISDVMMPKISGFEMLDIMRNTNELKDVKVIMLTALGQSDDQQRADKLGADRYLVKSQVTLEDIVKVAHELLEDEAAPATPAPSAAAPAEPVTPAAPAPAPEPVAATPVPAPAEPPAPAPEPEVKPEPAATPADPPETPKPAPDATASNEAAQPAAQEEADVEAKIEDFVAGATSEPTMPVVTKPADDSKDEEEEKTPEEKAASLVSDDKLMADAVEKLVASTDDDKEKKDEPAGDAAPSAPAAPAEPAEPVAPAAPPAPTVIPVSAAPDGTPAPAADEPVTPAPATPPAPAQETPEPEKEKKQSGPSSVSHTKIIQPPASSETKKDINQLLADEEAKEAQTVPGNTVVGSHTANKIPDSEDKPSGGPSAAPSDLAEPTPSSTAPPPDKVDPNSIAL
jgi:CheY-like chemotaxis protein